jgi:hypothetical protein
MHFSQMLEEIRVFRIRALCGHSWSKCWHSKDNRPYIIYPPPTFMEEFLARGRVEDLRIEGFCGKCLAHYQEPGSKFIDRASLVNQFSKPEPPVVKLAETLVSRANEHDIFDTPMDYKPLFGEEQTFLQEAYSAVELSYRAANTNLAHPQPGVEATRLFDTGDIEMGTAYRDDVELSNTCDMARFERLLVYLHIKLVETLIYNAQKDFDTQRGERPLLFNPIPLVDVDPGHTCSVCSEEMDGSSDEEFRCTDPVKLPCEHVYGKKCIQEWLDSLKSNEAGFSCPNCRASFWQFQWLWPDYEEEEPAYLTRKEGDVAPNWWLALKGYPVIEEIVEEDE